MKSNLIGIASLLAAASGVWADIIPGWRINPIGQGSLENPLPDAASVSLVVTLTGNSRFSAAGLRITPQMFPAATTLDLYNSAFGGDGPPNTALFQVFPAVEFDTYVSTSDRMLPSITGPVPPGGSGLFGPHAFDVAWGATPNSGPLGGANLEIARITFLHGRGFGGGFVAVQGEVRDSLNPNTAINVPPMPLPIGLPEPSSTLLAVATLAVARKRRRSR